MNPSNARGPGGRDGNAFPGLLLEESDLRVGHGLRYWF